MKKLKIVLCDQDADYITMFASYLMSRFKDLELHIFTTPESYFADTKDFDLALMGEDFNEVSDFKASGLIKKRYILSEEISEADNYIFKYQSMDDIILSIEELSGLKTGTKAGANSFQKTMINGVFSPISHELQLPFSMALAQSKEDFGRVLFIDLEELSIMPELIGQVGERNLMDYLYEISASESSVDLSDYVHHFMGFDYLSPFSSPDELVQIDEDTWKELFERLKNEDYDNVVVLFGRTIAGFKDLLSSLDNLYVLGKPGDYFKKSQEAFLNYVEKTAGNVSVENVLLPLSASNLSEGTYCIEELLQGNLGLFVRRLLKKTELVVA